MKIATMLRRIEGWSGDARLYRLSEPHHGNDYVIVSGSNVPFSGPETYIFGSNAEGECSDWGELEGSFRSAIDHAQALRDAGYEIASDA